MTVIEVDDGRDPAIDFIWWSMMVERSESGTKNPRTKPNRVPDEEFACVLNERGKLSRVSRQMTVSNLTLSVTVEQQND